MKARRAVCPRYFSAGCFQDGADPTDRHRVAWEISTRKGSNVAYKWHNVGNIDRDYTRNGLNQYAATTSATAGASGLTFGYSARGDLVSETVTGEAQPRGAWTYSSEGADDERELGPRGHDGAGRDGDDGLRQPGASGLGHERGTTTLFRYDGDHVATEYDGASGVLLRRYVWGVGDDEPLVSYEGDDYSSPSRWFQADERGSVVAVTDWPGTLIAQNTYDAYGIPGTANAGRFQYTGQMWLAGVGMYYYKARMYSPTLGRFMQTDPIGPDGGINLYAYTSNDPVNLIEPSGHCSRISGDGKGNLDFRSAVPGALRWRWR